MLANVGFTDRILRLAIGLILLFSPLLNIPAIWSSSSWAYLSMIVGIVLIGTGLFSFCPLYRVLGIGTKRS